MATGTHVAHTSKSEPFRNGAVGISRCNWTGQWDKELSADGPEGWVGIAVVGAMLNALAPGQPAGCAGAALRARCALTAISLNGSASRRSTRIAPRGQWPRQAPIPSHRLSE